jgi:uncharacterized protein (TIGR03382 family)
VPERTTPPATMGLGSSGLGGFVILGALAVAWLLRRR